MRLAVAFPRSKVQAGERGLDMVTMSAERLTAVRYNRGEGETLIQSVPLTFEEMVEALQLDQSPNYYTLIGRRAENVKRGEGIGFAVE